MNALLRALAEALADQAEEALNANGTALQAIDVEELVYQFKAMLEARRE